VPWANGVKGFLTTGVKMETMEKVETITLPMKLVNDLAGYIATKPFQEVAGLIAALQAEVTKQNPSK
jgi:hypothetical protein